MPGNDFLYTLEAVIHDRLRGGDAGSYTARLGLAGSRRAAQKVGEEAVEVALAAVDGTRAELLDEAADLLYHLLVLLALKDAGIADVTEVLARRHTD